MWFYRVIFIISITFLFSDSYTRVNGDIGYYYMQASTTGLRKKLSNFFHLAGFRREGVQ